MTMQRKDNFPPTPFSEWLRHEKEIDSNIGFRASNVDYVWGNENTGLWMLLEEKRYMSRLRPFQNKLFNKIDRAVMMSNCESYKGFHLLQFEKTTPDDGKIFLDNNEITKEELLLFLKFEQPSEWYCKHII